MTSRVEGLSIDAQREHPADEVTDLAISAARELLDEKKIDMEQFEEKYPPNVRDLAMSLKWNIINIVEVQKKGSSPMGFGIAEISERQFVLFRQEQREGFFEPSSQPAEYWGRIEADVSGDTRDRKSLEEIGRRTLADTVQEEVDKERS